MGRLRILNAAQAAMLATSRGPLAPVWRALHLLVLRGTAAWLRRAAPGSHAYASGSFGDGRPLYGVSDMDLVIVAPDERGAARRRIRARWKALCRRFPLAPHLIELAVYERADLERAGSAPVFTYGLDGGRGRDRAAYSGPDALPEPALIEGPGLYGPMGVWRPLGAAAPLPAPPEHDRQATRMTAWLQLQSWWRYAFRGCAHDPGPRTAYLCVKFVSEPVRILLWLEHGERVVDREAALRRGLELMPEEEPAIRAALDLQERLASRPTPPLAEMLPHLVRLSTRVAEVLRREVAPAGAMDVALDWEPGDLSAGADAPHTDWRALAWSWPLDESLVADPGDPRDPAAIARAAHRQRRGLQPALRADGLVVLPVADLLTGTARLRAAQCELTDPVSFALLSGDGRARFPDVGGWSARDWARRATAEHRAWLESLSDSLDQSPIARPIAAARAALFRASVEDGEPRLPLTSAATMRALANHAEDARGVAEAAAEAFRGWRDDERVPDPDVARALLAAVRRLDAYAGTRTPAEAGT
jgi:hypothetical protein